MSEAHKAARKAYWAAMTPEERTKRMRRLAINKQTRMTFKEKRAHALMMVAARREATAAGVDARKKVAQAVV